MARARRGKRKRLPAAVAHAIAHVQDIHDRRSQDLPVNAMVAAMIIDDPYGVDPGEKIVAFRSLRDDPLGAMHAAKQIDEVQYLAGRHWQRAFELSEIGGAKAMDPTKEYVDGGQIPQPTISDIQARASDDLAKARKELGKEGGSLVRDILGLGLTIVQAAAKRELHSEPERKYIGRRFRECLECIAYVYGYSTAKGTNCSGGA